MDITCPLCNQPDPLYSKKRQLYICEDCGHEFAPEEPFTPQRIFISYGHDEHTSLALQLRDDLRKRGHEVWFDEERLLPSKDWETRIEEGLNWTAAAKPHAAVILLLTPHSVRRPEGFCLNEVARALMLRLRIIPLMVVESEPPLSICRIQWLDMRECIPIHEKKDLYEPRFQRLLKALEKEELDYEGLQSRLLRTLQPVEFSADLFKLLRDFTGRQWVFDEIDAWFKNPDGTKLFWLTGAPGVGKSAIAAWVREHRREVAVYHFCDINSEEKRNPAKLVCSIAYQLSTQLPEYQERLGRLDLENIVQEYHEAYTLFDKLLVQPLSEGYPAPDRTIVVLIDALDEATSRRQNEIVRLLSRSADKTPPWLRFLVTSRPEPEITSSFQALSPYILDTDRSENLADLRQYITTMIPDITAAQTEELLKRSEGVFLYISHVVAGIKAKTLDLERIEDFPRGLGDVYQQFFDRQFGQDLNYYEEKIVPLLQPIIASYEPLTRQFLKAVCRIEEDTELERRLNRLGSLFPLSGEGAAETIRPFHRSISDWITDRKSAGHFVVAETDGHRVLAELCAFIPTRSKKKLIDSDLNQYLYRWGIRHLTEILNEIVSGSLEPDKDLNSLEPLQQLKKLLDNKTFVLKKIQYQDVEDFFDDICETYHLFNIMGNGDGLNDLKETTCRAFLKLLFVHQVQGEGHLDISTTQALLVYRNDKRFYEDFLNYALQQEEYFLRKYPTKETKLFFLSLKEILAGLERRKENLDQALTLLDDCKYQFSVMEDYKNMAKAEYEIGYIYYLKGNVESFQQVLIDSQKHSLQSKDHIGYHITRCVYHVFLANASIISYSKLQSVLNEALPVFKKYESYNENARRWVVNVYAHSIIAAYEENRQNDAISWFNRLETNQWVKKYKGQDYLYRYLARIHVLNKDYQKAKTILLRYLSIDNVIIKEVRRESLVQEYLVLARVLKELNETAELQNVIDICRNAEEGFANLYFKRRIYEIIE